MTFLHRAVSPPGLLSPSRGLFTQNGDKDWDTGSTASSPASIPEYTGNGSAILLMCLLFSYHFACLLNVMNFFLAFAQEKEEVKVLYNTINKEHSIVALGKEGT